MTLRCAVLTISDRSARGEREDRSGPALVDKIHAQGWQVSKQAIVPDDLQEIVQTLIAWADSDMLDVLLTTGGTGFAPRDITPEATRRVIERETPGLVEAMRAASMHVTPHAMLSRAVAGIRGHTLIVNLPGSPRGAVENFQIVLPVLPHAVELLRDAPEAEASHRQERPAD